MTSTWRRYMEPGLHLVHKAVGETSFSHVAAAMEAVRAAGFRRDRRPVCHGGALDPFAEGLLLLLVGRATRLFELFHTLPKEYVARVELGAETDTGDAGGKVVARGRTSSSAPAALEAALAGLRGFTDQVPPAHSNKRVEGERAWIRARRGEEVELPAARVYLHEVEVLSLELPRAVELRLVCRGGYYVRAFARDLGRALGCFAHLSRLRRTAIGPWRDPAPGARVALRGPAVLPWCSTRELAGDELAALRAGETVAALGLRPPAWRLPAGFPDPDAPVAGTRSGRLVALLRGPATGSAGVLRLAADLAEGV